MSKRGRPKIGSERIIFTITPEQADYLRRAADKKGLSVAEYVRNLVAADMLITRQELEAFRASRRKPGRPKEGE